MILLSAHFDRLSGLAYAGCIEMVMLDKLEIKENISLPHC